MIEEIVKGWNEPDLMVVPNWKVENLIRDAFGWHIDDNCQFLMMTPNYTLIPSASRTQQFVEGLSERAEGFQKDVRDSSDFAWTLRAVALMIQSRLAKEDKIIHPFPFGYLHGELGKIREYKAKNLIVTGTREENLAVYLVDAETGVARYISNEDGKIDLVII